MATIIDGILTGVIDSEIINETYIIPDGVTRIGDDAFSDCYNLKKITIPEGVTSIGQTH